VADLLDDPIGAHVGCAMIARLRHRLLERALTLWRPARQPFPAGDLLSRLADHVAELRRTVALIPHEDFPDHPSQNQSRRMQEGVYRCNRQ
jgi:hypothetical protein